MRRMYSLVYPFGWRCEIDFQTFSIPRRIIRLSWVVTARNGKLRTEKNNSSNNIQIRRILPL